MPAGTPQPREAITQTTPTGSFGADRDPMRAGTRRFSDHIWRDDPQMAKAVTRSPPAEALFSSTRQYLPCGNVAVRFVKTLCEPAEAPPPRGFEPDGQVAVATVCLPLGFFTGFAFTTVRSGDDLRLHPPDAVGALLRIAILSPARIGWCNGSRPRPQTV